MSSFIRGVGLITGCVSVSYLTVTAMMQDSNKPYRGHLNIKGAVSTTNIYPPTEISENIDELQNPTLSPSTSLPRESRDIL